MFLISCKICNNPYIWEANVKGNFTPNENSDLLKNGNIFKN